MSEPIKVKKADLLSRLQENRDKHRKVFEAAVEGFVEDGVAQLKAEAERLRQGRVRSVYVSIPRPEDHTKDYDRIILMVQMSTSEQFTLSESDFAKYVMDDWAWKREWNKMSSHYAGRAYIENYGAYENDDM